MNSFVERFLTATKKAVVTCDGLEGYFYGPSIIELFSSIMKAIYIITRVLAFDLIRF